MEILLCEKSALLSAGGGYILGLCHSLVKGADFGQIFRTDCERVQGLALAKERPQHGSVQVYTLTRSYLRECNRWCFDVEHHEHAHETTGTICKEFWRLK